MINIEECFTKNEDEYGCFNKISNPISSRPDICAFLLLDKLVPGKNKLISASEHDEIFLDIDIVKLSEVITEEEIIQLMRCSVRYSEEYECFSMFV